MNTSEKLTRSTYPILIPLTALAILITLVAVVFWATVLFAAPVAAPKGDIAKNKLGSADASYSNNEGKSATHSQAKHAKSNQFWWPDQLDLSPLRDHDSRSNPLGEDFNYKQAFSDIDLVALKKDINTTLTDSQQWWPADWGNYGPFLIRMAWLPSERKRALRRGAESPVKFRCKMPPVLRTGPTARQESRSSLRAGGGLLHALAPMGISGSYQHYHEDKRLHLTPTKYSTRGVNYTISLNRMRTPTRPNDRPATLPI
ncbi:hypothetical protein A1QK_22005 [Vibrio genomosp. F10 str. 9ZD137]|nr:hypothetical protein [Vibrio genomosp. F10]OEF09005.1 hypothetical protein A1QK_22005 [Vibrio genomosp. F10 str. 9ZD137]